MLIYKSSYTHKKNLPDRSTSEFFQILKNEITSILQKLFKRLQQGPANYGPKAEYNPWPELTHPGQKPGFTF